VSGPARRSREPVREGNVDSRSLGGLEAEPSVVARIAFEHDERNSHGVRSAESVGDQGLSDPARLLVGPHRERDRFPIATVGSSSRTSDALLIIT
jgi:hypothetical protein